MTPSLRTLTSRMLREEWRLHTRIVGSRAFTAFPPLILIGTLLLLMLTSSYGVGSDTLLQIAHLVVFVVGFHLGNVALGDRDSPAGLHRKLTLLLYSSQTLPVSSTKLIGAFILRNLIYYSGLLLLPLSIGFLAVSPISMLLVLFTAFVGMYLWGLVAALLGANILDYGVWAKIPLTVTFAAVTTAWLLNLPVEYLLPYSFAADPSLVTAAASLLPLLVATLLGVALFSPTIDGTLRKIEGRFKPWSNNLPTAASPVAARTLLNIVRGSGGLIKLVVSATLIFGFSLYLFILVGRHTAYDPHLGIGIASLLSLESVLVYTWLVQFDSFDEYAHLPMDANTLVYGKAIAFGVIAIPLAAVHYFIAALLLDITPLDALLGGGVLLGLLVLFFGVTFALAQFEPHHRLLHPVRFCLFIIAIFAPLLAVFTTAFVVPTLGGAVGIGIAVLSITGIIVGLASLYHAAHNWTVRIS